MGIGCNASELDSKLQRNLILGGFLNSSCFLWVGFFCSFVGVFSLFFILFLPLFITKLFDIFY